MIVGRKMEQFCAFT